MGVHTYKSRVETLKLLLANGARAGIMHGDLEGYKLAYPHYTRLLYIYGQQEAVKIPSEERRKYQSKMSR
jgi:hypothetical protein